MQAALLRITLPHLDRWCDGRRAAAAAYEASGLGEVCTLPRPSAGCTPAWHLYVVRHPEPEVLGAAFQAAGIGHKGYYRVPTHRQVAMREYADGPELPVTDELARTHLAIPMSPVLNPEQVAEVAEAAHAAAPNRMPDAPPAEHRGLSRPSPLRSAGRAGRRAGRAGLLPRLSPPLRRSRRRARPLPRPVRPHGRLRGHRQRRDPRALRGLPALDALLVAERVPADRAGVARLRARARRLRRGRAAEAAVRAAARVRVGEHPDRRPRPLRPADARLPRRRPLHRARRL